MVQTTPERKAEATCSFLHIISDLSPSSPSATQDEVAAGRCCSSGCGQLCQHLPGRNGVPRLEAKVW